MSLKIRLARGGTKKRPYYRIVVADVRKPRDGRFIEKVGTHNPLLPKDHADRVRLNEERIKHWLGHGARPTDRVLRFLDEAGIMSRPKRNNPIKGQPGKKRLEREEAKRQAVADAKAAAEAETAGANESSAAAAGAAENAGEGAAEDTLEAAAGDAARDTETGDAA